MAESWNGGRGEGGSGAGLGAAGSAQLAPMAHLTTRENPWPLRLLNAKIKTYIERMSELWVEGQVVEYRPRPGTRMVFFTLRDLQDQSSITVKAMPAVLDQAGAAFAEGARVVVRARADFYPGNGQLSLFASQIHTAGLGDLLAQIEALRKRLAAEGLFDAGRKKPLPFLPRTIGLVCGKNAKAKDDVITNASARWPLARFQIREVAVQGALAARQIAAAAAELDRLEQVEVIVIARGGGAVEDLLPFSDETLVRTIAALATPVVSAIGHEADAPLLDLVADYRASTPTDAARRIVPDLAEQQAFVSEGRGRLNAVAAAAIERERQFLAAVRERPVMRDPGAALTRQSELLEAVRARLRAAAALGLGGEKSRIASLTATLRALSPQAILERGYSLLLTSGGEVVRSTEQLSRGAFIEGVLADGRLVAQVVGMKPSGPAQAGND